VEHGCVPHGRNRRLRLSLAGMHAGCGSAARAGCSFGV
jgi:hypothetical protein